MSRYCIQGRLYKANQDFYAKCNSSTSKKRDVFYLVKNEEILEFRYFSPANFRTEDDIYMRVEVHEFDRFTKPYGKIWQQVYLRNQNKLAAILSEKLFDPIEICTN